MKEAREAILTKLNELLTDAITVDGLTIPYYADAFGDQPYGIYKESYRGEADNSKHHFAEIAFINLVCFARGQSEAFVAEMSRKVRGVLQASVNSTIALTDGLQATYTRFNSIVSLTELDNGVTVHRDTLELQLRIDEHI